MVDDKDWVDDAEDRLKNGSSSDVGPPASDRLCRRGTGPTVEDRDIERSSPPGMIQKGFGPRWTGTYERPPGIAGLFSKENG